MGNFIHFMHWIRPISQQFQKQSHSSEQRLSNYVLTVNSFTISRMPVQGTDKSRITLTHPKCQRSSIYKYKTHRYISVSPQAIHILLPTLACSQFLRDTRFPPSFAHILPSSPNILSITPFTLSTLTHPSNPSSRIPVRENFPDLHPPN